jgi:hypothetical protein
MKLEDVLELMHLARRRYTTIEASVRRRFEPGLIEAHRSNDAGSATPVQGRVEAVDHVWFESPTTWRVDAESGPGAGLVNIHDGDHALRNFRLEDLGEGYGRGVYLGGPQTYRQVMWEPNMLVPEMRLEPSETERVAGREGVRVRARPRPTTHDYVVLWPRADRYELVVDIERGILLRLSLFVGGREAMSDEVLAVRFDEPLTKELLHSVKQTDVP